MPIYEYECSECGTVSEHVCMVEDKPDSISCTSCGGYAVSIISMPAAMKPQWEEYWDENLGDEPVLVKGRRHRKEIMRKEGLEEVEMSSQRKRETLQKLRYLKRTGNINEARNVQTLDKGGLHE